MLLFLPWLWRILTAGKCCSAIIPADVLDYDPDEDKWTKVGRLAKAIVGHGMSLVPKETADYCVWWKLYTTLWLLIFLLGSFQNWFNTHIIGNKLTRCLYPFQPLPTMLLLYLYTVLQSITQYTVHSITQQYVHSIMYKCLSEAFANRTSRQN